MLAVRVMSAADSDCIAKLDVLAFGEYCRQTGRNPFSPRTRQNILASLSLNPSGCFVAETDEPVGFVFSRRWGSVGWIGTFGVHPSMQGQSVGKALLTAAVTQLEKAACTTIGLETMAQTSFNVGFYVRGGFQPVFPSLAMRKNTELQPHSASYSLFSQLSRNHALAAVTSISQSVRAGLDYASEVANAHEYKWGETLLFGWPEPWAFVIVRTVPRREGRVESLSEIGALVVRSESRQQFRKILQAVEDFACSRGASRVTLSINAEDWPALQQSQTYGFRLGGTLLRMVVRHDQRSPAGMDLSEWAM